MYVSLAAGKYSLLDCTSSLMKAPQPTSGSSADSALFEGAIGLVRLSLKEL